VPLPGLPSRPRPDEEEEEQDGSNIPPPPRVQRSPTPPTPAREESPVRIAIPVARSRETEIEAPEERYLPPVLPTQSIPVPAEEDLTEEPSGHGQHAGNTGGKRALVQYDYEKAEDNELELTEGDYVTNIEMVDEDWWMGTNSKGESGLFPSNYVELVEEEEAPAPAPAQAPRPTPAPVPTPAAAPAAEPAGPTATALYDYEAAEDNELSFGENDKITSLVSLYFSLVFSMYKTDCKQEFLDPDWWLGTNSRGESGLFPSNYVQLDK
jgi:hypothetical protein